MITIWTHPETVEIITKLQNIVTSLETTALCLTYENTQPDSLIQLTDDHERQGAIAGIHLAVSLIKEQIIFPHTGQYQEVK